MNTALQNITCEIEYEVRAMALSESHHRRAAAHRGLDPEEDTAANALKHARLVLERLHKHALDLRGVK